MRYQKSINEQKGLDFDEAENSKRGCKMIINVPENASENASEKLSKIQKAIINEIWKNNIITYDELSLMLDKDRATVMRNISKLKTRGFLVRVSPDKGGHWSLINKKEEK